MTESPYIIKKVLSTSLCCKLSELKSSKPFHSELSQGVKPTKKKAKSDWNEPDRTINQSKKTNSLENQIEIEKLALPVTESLSFHGNDDVCLNLIPLVNNTNAQNY